MNCRARLAIALCLCLGLVVQAHASVFNWSYTGTVTDSNVSVIGSSIAGSGTLTTGNADLGGYDITNISGTWNGVSITGPDSSEAIFFPIDNILFYPNVPFLDFAGALFTDSNDTFEVNIFFDGTGYHAEQAAIDQSSLTTTDGSFTVSETPLPGAWPLFMSGLGLICIFVWRTQRKRADQPKKSELGIALAS